MGSRGAETLFDAAAAAGLWLQIVEPDLNGGGSFRRIGASRGLE
jgi:hypothetical protein